MSETDPAVPGRWSRAHLSVVGLVVAGGTAWTSLMPSLLPRTWYYQGLITGIAMAIGYGIGVLARACWVRFVAPRLPIGSRWLATGYHLLRWCRTLAPFLLLVFLAIATMTAVRWQNEVSDLVGSARPPMVDYMKIPWVAAAVFALIVLAGRGVRALYRRILRLGRRRLGIPETPAKVVSVAIVAVLVVGLTDGVIPALVFEGANQAFRVRNDEDLDGVTAPDLAERSGGPSSYARFDDLGLQGRRFVAGGAHAAELTRLLGRPAKEPIRLYAGLDSAPDDDARAALVVRELDRTRAWERDSVVVAASTGTGWINPNAAQAFELLGAGDVATVGTQYSFLPSWISFLADKEKADAAGAALVSAVAAWRDRLPAGAHRPKLYVYGESLGTRSGEAGFSGLRDIRATVDGVLWMGPPNANPVWHALVERRDPGSREAEPVYADGLLVRFTEDPAELRDVPRDRWLTPRVLYVQHATDPVVWWNPELLYSRPDWLAEPAGKGRHPGMMYLPFVSFWQVTADLGNAIGGSEGYGHLYDSQILDGWAAMTDRPGWTAAQSERFHRLHDEAMADQPRG